MRQIPSVYSELNLVEEKVQKIIDKNFNRLSPLLYKLILILYSIEKMELLLITKLFIKIKH